MHLQQLVELLVHARAAAVQERVQRLLLAVFGEAPEPLHARPRVHAARLALLERARQAAAAAGLPHQLAALGRRRALGDGSGVALLARHEGGGAAGGAQEREQQEEGDAQLHGTFIQKNV